MQDEFFISRPLATICPYLRSWEYLQTFLKHIRIVSDHLAKTECSGISIVYKTITSHMTNRRLSGINRRAQMTRNIAIG